MEVSFIPRDRERDRGEAYQAGSNAVRIPGYPDEMRDVVPMPDGTPGPRPQDRYGREWVQAERVRQLKLEADLLYQFATLVASKTSHRLDTYWRGGSSGQAMLDMMIANVVTDSTSSVRATPVTNTEDREAILKQAFAKVSSYDTQERVRRMSQGLSMSDDSRASLSKPELRQEWERLVRAADASAANKPAAASSSSSSALSSTGRSTSLAPPSGRTIPASSGAPIPPAPGHRIPSTFDAPAPPPGPLPSGIASTTTGTPLRPRPLCSITPETPAEARRREQSSATQEEEEPAKAVDPVTGDIVYGVEDKWIMLLRLMLRGATQTDLKAWALLYNVPETEVSRADPRSMEQYLADLSKVRALLSAGEGGADWVRAPQHTGWIFFTEQFTGAVASAASEVRNLCGKAWVHELDLMTHDEVRDYFATLVANKMLKSRATAFGRYGGTTSMQASHQREHAGLIQLFRRLVRKPNGMLGIAGQIDMAGDDARAATGQQRRSYMAQHGQYYSDVYRY